MTRTASMYLFFFSSRRRHTRCYRDWSSDVCSSDLARAPRRSTRAALRGPRARCRGRARLREPRRRRRRFAGFRRQDPRGSRTSRPATVRSPRPRPRSFPPRQVRRPPRRATRFKHRCSLAANEAPMLDGMEVAEVAARAAGENFPVGSILFPRSLRPHVRALYCYARLVDELGDAYEGDRLAALDELEAEVELAFEGEPTWPVLRNVQPTVREFDLPREPFLRLIEANRIDQRVAEYETWDDVKHYCVHSANPVGRLVLGLLGRDG